MTLSDFVNDMLRSRSAPELWLKLGTRLEQYGFDRLVYAYTHYRTQTGLGDPKDMVFMTHGLGQRDLRQLLNHSALLNNPLVRWGLANEGALPLHRVDEALAPMNALENLTLKVARNLGISNGYALSFHKQSLRAAGGLGLIARRDLEAKAIDQIWQRDGADITMICNTAHLRMLTLPHRTGRQLTKRQREVLEWVGDGKTTQDIADIMGLTPATVEKHMRLAREVMDVDTTAQAVLKASFLNQVFVPDEPGLTEA